MNPGPGKLRRDCRFYMVYGKPFCRHVWVDKILAEPKPLDLGCDAVTVDGVTTYRKCPDYTPVDWKRASLSREQQEELDE